ncbi:hypothetical protein, conserved, partial [Leishmania lindenbergi]
GGQLPKVCARNDSWDRVHSLYEMGCKPPKKLLKLVRLTRSAGIRKNQFQFGEVIIGRSGMFVEFMTTRL